MSSDIAKYAAAQAASGPVSIEAVNHAAQANLVVRQSIEPADLRRLFECLKHEDCVHSWRNFGPDGAVDDLLAWENQRRPTQIFFFYAKRAGELRLVAAGAVADRLTRDFPHAGFCVLGRCYIMPEFRGQGFYRRILHYRLEHCRARFGSSLNAVHIGSVSDRITSAITNHRLPGWPPFIHVGEEELRVAGELRTVGDYMLLTPDYVQAILGGLAGPRAPACVVELGRILSTLESGAVRNLGVLANGLFEQARSLGWFLEHDSAALEKLLLFCSSIPLIGFHQRTCAQGGSA